MVITVKLFGDLRDYLPEGKMVCRAEAADGSTVGEVLDHFGVPRDKPRIILVNSHRSRLERVLEDGDDGHGFRTGERIAAERAVELPLVEHHGGLFLDGSGHGRVLLAVVHRFDRNLL